MSENNERLSDLCMKREKILLQLKEKQIILNNFALKAIKNGVALNKSKEVLFYEMSIHKLEVQLKEIDTEIDVLKNKDVYLAK